MKKFFMLAAVVALVAAALALPAMAQRNDGGLVNFDDCFPFCDNDGVAEQSVEQEAQDSDGARFNDEDNNGDEARFFDRFDDEEEFFDFFDDRFDSEEEFFDFFDDRFDDGSGDDGSGDDVASEPVISQEIGQEAQSGDVAMSFDVSSSGDYAQQCAAPLQFGNTGNLQNAQGFLQYSSTADDVGFGGSSFNFSPSVSTECNQAVQQSAAASSGY